MSDPLQTEVMQVDTLQVAPGGDALIPVPSGQPVTLQEVIWNVPGPSGLTLRFRFVAPQIASASEAGVDYEHAATDMQHLCESYVLPRIAEFGPTPAQIVISLADQAVPFGETAPEVTQFFDAYSYVDGACILEMF